MFGVLTMDELIVSCTLNHVQISFNEVHHIREVVNHIEYPTIGTVSFQLCGRKIVSVGFTGILSVRFCHLRL